MLNAVYCVKCRKPIGPTDLFCKSCGADQRPSPSQQLSNPKAESPGNSPLFGRVAIGGAAVFIVIGLYFGFMAVQNYMASLPASAPPSSIRRKAQVQNPSPINRQSRQDVTAPPYPFPTQQDQYRQQQQADVETRQQTELAQGTQQQQEAEAARQDQIRQGVEAAQQDQIRQQQAAQEQEQQRRSTQEQARHPSLRITQASIKTYVGAYIFYHGQLLLEVQVTGEVENIGSYAVMGNMGFANDPGSIQIAHNNHTYKPGVVGSEINGGRFTLSIDRSSLLGPHVDEVGVYTITVELQLYDQRGTGPPITLNAKVALPQSPTQTYAYPSSDFGSSRPPRPDNTSIYLYQVFSSGN